MWRYTKILNKPFNFFHIAPGPNPSIIWDTTHMQNNHINANPPLIANGGVTLIENSVLMDGVSGYLDAGDSDG